MALTKVIGAGLGKVASSDLDGAVTINESSADVDFRVESNGNANMLFVDGGNDRVGIGTSSPAFMIQVDNPVALSGSGNDYYLAVGNTSSNSRRAVALGVDGVFGNAVIAGYNTFSPGLGDLIIDGLEIKNRTNGTDRIKIASNGDISFYEDTGTTPKLFWDASEEALSIGSTTNNSAAISATVGVGNYAYRIYRTDNQEVGGLYNATNGSALFLKDSSGNSDVVLSSYGDSYFLAGNVGIGTSSPDSDLHVYDSDGDCNLILETGTNNSQVGFADSASNFVGKIQYNHPSNYMGFTTNGSERMRIDSSGNLIVGSSSASGVSSGGKFYATPTSGIYAAASGDNAGYFNRNSNDGSIVEFRKGNSAVGSIGVTSSDQFYIARSTGNHGIKFKNSATMPSSSAGQDADNVQDLGSSSVRWKDLYLSSGLSIKGSDPKITLEHSNENGTAKIYTTAQSAIILDADPDNTDNGTPIQFKIDGSEVGRFDSGGRLIAPYGVTLGTSAGTYAAGNTLDDYEEGTWNPSLTPSNGSFTSITYQSRDGRYTKIGNIVTLSCRLSTNAITIGAGSGNVEVTNLPFNTSSSSAPGSALSFNANWASGNPAFAFLLDSSGTVRLHQSVAAGAYNLGTPTTTANLNTGSNSNYVYFVLTYETS